MSHYKADRGFLHQCDCVTLYIDLRILIRIKDNDIRSPVCFHGAIVLRREGYKVFKLIAFTARNLVVTICKIKSVLNPSHSWSQRQEDIFKTRNISSSYRVNEDFVRSKSLQHTHYPLGKSFSARHLSRRWSYLRQSRSTLHSLIKAEQKDLS